jgi:DNA-binding NarL/FixJ family response regulator
MTAATRTISDPTRFSSGRPFLPHLVFIETRPAVAEAFARVFEEERIGRTSIASSSEELISEGGLEDVDVIVLEVGKTDLYACAEAEALLNEDPTLRLVAMTATSDDGTVVGLRGSGFRGLVRKDASLIELTSTVLAVARGELSFPSVARNRSLESKPTEVYARLLARHLTLREHQVLGMLVEGLSSAEIAEDLKIKSATVRTHIQNIMMKLQVHSRLQAVMFAVRHGLVPVAKRETG